MKYMTMRAFVKGGYRHLVEPTILTVHAEPFAFVTPIEAAGVRETTPEELASIAKLLPHIEAASPRPAQEIGETALTVELDPEQPGATPGTRPTAGGGSSAPAGKAWPKPSKRRGS